MKHTIRNANSSDLPFLLGICFPDGEPDEGFIESIIEDKRNVSLVCDNGKQISGFIIGRVLIKNLPSSPDNSIWMQATYNELLESIVPYNHTFCEIYNLWVAPDYRQKGISVILKQAIETYLTNEQVYYITSRTEKKNSPVVQINKRLKYSVLKQNLMPEHVCFFKELTNSLKSVSQEDLT